MLTFWRGVQSKYEGSIKSAVIGFHQHAHGSGALERKRASHYSTHTSSLKLTAMRLQRSSQDHTHTEKSVCCVWVYVCIVLCIGLLYPLSKILNYWSKVSRSCWFHKSKIKPDIPIIFRVLFLSDGGKWGKCNILIFSPIISQCLHFIHFTNAFIQNYLFVCLFKIKVLKFKL